MFWDKAFTQSQNIEALLEKDDVTVEEFLDDEDILQECKTQNRSIVSYFTRPDIIKRLIELTITEPPENVSLTVRFKHANMACEILTFGIPSLDEKLVDDIEILQILYSYLENDPPLNPLLSSFFSKTFTMLLTKKTEQDWFLYQKMCLQLIEYIKSRGNFLNLIFKHFATPVIPDLLMQMIASVQGAQLKINLYEWLAEQKLVETLIVMLGDPEESNKHSNISECLCELIKHGRVMRQSEQDNDTYAPTFIGSNPLLQSIENEKTVCMLLDVILQPNAKESSIVSGILVLLTLIQEVIVEDQASDRCNITTETERELHKKNLLIVVKVIASRLGQFHEILVNPPSASTIRTPAAELAPPFGLVRLQVCKLFAVLLQTGLPDICLAIRQTEVFNTLLVLFKEYCWNNFLHSEVEKCFQHIFAQIKLSDNNISHGDYEKKSNADSSTTNESNNDNEDQNMGNNDNKILLQEFLITECKLIPKLIDCWMHNKLMQNAERGRRLGYMGHLIKILAHISYTCAHSNVIRQLIEDSLTLEESITWNSIIDSSIGEFSKDLSTQQKFLADCDAYAIANLYIAKIPDSFTPTNTINFVNDIGSMFGNSLLTKMFEKNVESGGAVYIDNMLNDYNEKVIGSSFIDDDDENQISDDGPLQMNQHPWTSSDPFDDNDTGMNDTTTQLNDFSSFDNFADFDTHFNSFVSDLGDGITAITNEQLTVDNSSTLLDHFDDDIIGNFANRTGDDATEIYNENILTDDVKLENKSSNSTIISSSNIEINDSFDDSNCPDDVQPSKTDSVIEIEKSMVQSDNEVNNTDKNVLYDKNDDFPIVDTFNADDNKFNALKTDGPKNNDLNVTNTNA